MKREPKKKLKPWDTLSKKIVHKNDWFSVHHEKFVTPKLSIGNYFVIRTKEKSRSVMIVPVEGDDIIMIRQYRYTTKKWCLEVPGGGVENDATAQKAASAELQEELGFSGKLKKIGEYCPWSGPTSEICSVYLATGLKHVGQDLEETEDLKLKRMKIKDVYAMLDDGKFSEGQTIAALSFARKYLLKS
jgi:ADP-ribose pyrophosphatase